MSYITETEYLKIHKPGSSPRVFTSHVISLEITQTAKKKSTQKRKEKKHWKFLEIKVIDTQNDAEVYFKRIRLHEIKALERMDDEIKVVYNYNLCQKKDTTFEVRNLDPSFVDGLVEMWELREHGEVHPKLRKIAIKNAAKGELKRKRPDDRVVPLKKKKVESRQDSDSDELIIEDILNDTNVESMYRKYNLQEGGNAFSYTQPRRSKRLRYKPPSDFQEDWEDANAETRGFVNLGNTCYMNVVLFALKNSKYFMETIENPIAWEETKKNLGNDTILNELQSLLTSEKLEVHPDQLKKLFSKSKEFEGFEMEDAEEFYLSCVKHINLELANTNAKNPIENFHGVLEHNYTCVDCKFTKSNVEDFYDISLPVPNESLEHLSITSALQAYFSPQPIDRKCDKCSSEKSMLSSVVKSAPNVLVIQIKRFFLDRVNGVSKVHKNHAPMRIDLELPVNSLTGTKSDSVYQISSFIHHSGEDISHGHYSSHCKIQDGSWEVHNDNSVVSATQQEVLSDRHQKGVYLLFYEKK